MMRVATAAALCACMFVGAMHAQTIISDGLGRREYFDYFAWLAEPTWTRQELMKEVDSIPELSDAQRTVIASMYDSFFVRFQVAGSDMIERANLITKQVANDPSGRVSFGRHPDRIEGFQWNALPQLEWQVRRADIEAAFHDEVAAVLSDEQLDAWERVVQAARREKSLPYLRMAWSGRVSSLTTALDAIELDDAERERIRALRDAYEAELDQLLRAYEREQPEGEIELQRLRALQSAGEATDETNKRVQELLDRSGAILNRSVLLNQKYQQQFKHALGEKRGEVFIRACGIILHPRIFEPSPAERAIDALLSLESLDAETRALVKDLERRHYLERTPIYDKLVRDELEGILDPEANKAKWQGFDEWWAEGLANPNVYSVFMIPMIEEWRARHELHRRTCARLRAIIPPHQREQLAPTIRLWMSF